MNEWHPLETTLEWPTTMNDPFSYEPHPVCRLAAEAVRQHLGELTEWADEVASGKMFGVLVCTDADGRLGFLAAYSGQILGRSDWPWFVPAVFDYLQPDGYFRQEEVRITALNHRIEQLEANGERHEAEASLNQLKAEAEAEIESYREVMRQAKARRDALRQLAAGVSPADMERESQFQKAELRRLKQRWRERIGEAEVRLAPMLTAIEALRRERHEHSDALQRWLFDQFLMLNAQGQRRSLTDIFAPTPQRVPPAGAGECCAPRLLQYAYSHGLRPLQIAEFWQGRSPRMEVRHDGEFYTACRGKCLPILRWMLGEGGESKVGSGEEEGDLKVIDIDDDIVVIEKPSGLLSVPGLTGAVSAEQLLRERYGEVYMVHRLDMDTSGLMVVARTMAAYHHLQRQFLERTVGKQYVALVDRRIEGSGTISLPLRPDLDDRPRQLVDHAHGRPAITDYEAIGQTPDGHTLLRLTPHTGRTHQLRVHCAHADGLAAPIIGDTLYGRPTAGQRLCLHAARLSFQHPATGQRVQFNSPVPF